MQVRMLIGRQAGEIVEMAYDRALANRELGHVEFVRDGDVQLAAAAVAAGVATAAPEVPPQVIHRRVLPRVARTRRNAS